VTERGSVHASADTVGASEAVGRFPESAEVPNSSILPAASKRVREPDGAL
jgi:hypothetical protein